MGPLSRLTAALRRHACWAEHHQHWLLLWHALDQCAALPTQPMIGCGLLLPPAQPMIGCGLLLPVPLLLLFPPPPLGVVQALCCALLSAAWAAQHQQQPGVARQQHARCRSPCSRWPGVRGRWVRSCSCRAGARSGSGGCGLAACGGGVGACSSPRRGGGGDAAKQHGRQLVTTDHLACCLLGVQGVQWVGRDGARSFRCSGPSQPFLDLW